MVHTAILGRRLNMPVMNLGFSGNGKNGSNALQYILRAAQTAVPHHFCVG